MLTWLKKYFSNEDNAPTTGQSLDDITELDAVNELQQACLLAIENRKKIREQNRMARFSLTIIFLRGCADT